MDPEGTGTHSRTSSLDGWARAASPTSGAANRTAPHAANTTARHAASTVALHAANTTAPHADSTVALHAANTTAPHADSTVAPHAAITTAPHADSTVAPHADSTRTTMGHFAASDWTYIVHSLSLLYLINTHNIIMHECVCFV